MQIIFGLMISFWVITLVLSITLFIWDTFIATDKRAMEVKKIMKERAERIKVSYGAGESKAMVKEGQ